MSDHDTIAAIATAPGRGGVGIIRVSGNEVERIARAIVGTLPEARYAHYSSFLGSDDEAIDQGVALFFSKPNSFTGEDVLELQGHGGPVVMDRLLARVIELGARQARAGEFSERAFLNDRMDLVQAEAVSDLIAAESEQSAKAAMHSLQGDFSESIESLLQGLTQLRVHVESALDFPEEEIDFLQDDAIKDRFSTVESDLLSIHSSCRQGRILREGITLVIAGEPNVGKSSLLNRLAGNDAAIVSEVAGTTRDVLREHIQIQGVPIHLIDTAGIRESQDIIEKEGVRRAKKEIESADIVLQVADINDGEVRAPYGDILIYNKIDICETEPEQSGQNVYVSARTGAGFDRLEKKILDWAGYDGNESTDEGLYTARRRHIEAIEETQSHIARAREILTVSQDGELMAEELRLAQRKLSEITGEFSSDDLLGKIFSEFCIGK